MDPPNPAKPLAFPVFFIGGRGKRRFLKGGGGRLQKWKKRKGKQSLNNGPDETFKGAGRLNPENYLGIY
jgi:hypothetical protein